MPITVVRGRLEEPAADRAYTGRLLERVAAERVPALRVWRPPRHLAFGRLDTAAEGYEVAASAAADMGFPPIRRTVGGRAAAVTPRCVAIVLLEPTDGRRTTIRPRYAAIAGAVRETLADLGASVSVGEPAASFCPGEHSLQGAGKLAGFGQRLRADVAMIGGLVVVDDVGPIARVLDRVYGHLGVPFEPRTVGSVALAGGPASPDTVRAAIEEAVVGDRDRVLEEIVDRET